MNFIIIERNQEVVVVEKNIKSNVLYIIGDIHADGEMFRKKEFEKAIKIMGNAPKIVLGDIVDYGFFNNMLSQYRKIDTINTECDLELYIANMIDYVMERLKNTLMVCEGNHDIRAAKLSGENLLYYICKKKKIPYIKGQGLLKLNKGNKTYKILCTHGTGGGRKETVSLNRAVEFAKTVTGVDLIAIGHFHRFVYSEVTKTNFITDVPTTEVTDVVTVPSFLGFEVYAQKATLPPPMSGIVRVTLNNPLKIDYIRIGS